VPIIEGVVEEFGNSKSGKPKIKISGGWYHLGNTVMHDVTFGDRVSVEWEGWSSSDNSSIRLKMIQGWAMVASSDGKHGVPAGAGEKAPPPKQEPSAKATPPADTDYARQATVTQGGQPAANTPKNQPKAYEDLPRDSLEGRPLHDADQLRLISNVLAALVNTGVVKTRTEAVKWIFALGCGLRGVQFLESEIPF